MSLGYGEGGLREKKNELHLSMGKQTISRVRKYEGVDFCLEKRLV
jgi:hypothetical protein